jgi:hypothetical protein
MIKRLFALYFLALLPTAAAAAQNDAPLVDMVPYIATGGVLYEVQHSSGSQARHQTQYAADRFFHTKGHEAHAEWEELWYSAETIYRGTDTSPGAEQYYTLRDGGQYGAAWAPRYWRVGDVFERNPLVTFYHKSDCSLAITRMQRSWLRFEARHASYTFAGGITLPNVVELAWLTSLDEPPVERYFYAAGYGLVGWQGAGIGSSGISEIHAPGQRPDNSRETIRCLDRSGALPGLDIAPLRLWLAPGFTLR